MKKLLTLLLLPLGAMAQPVVQNAENYTIGDTINYIVCNPIGSGLPGANQTWNFSGLTPAGDTITTWIIAPPVNNPFPAADFVIKDEGDTTFTYVDTAGGESVNLGSLNTSLSDTLEFVTGQLRMLQPFTYLDTAVDSYSYSMINGPFPVYAEGTQHFEADGYGTLIVPGDTIQDVLRVRIVYYEHDSIDGIGNIDINGILHAWYSETGAAPLLRVDSIDITSDIAGFQDTLVMDVRYLYTPQPTAIEKVSQAPPVIVTGNLQGSELFLSGNFDRNKQYEIAMYNLNGQKVYSSSFIANNETQRFNIGTEPASGMYLVTVRKKGDIVPMNVIKVMKQ